MKYEDLLEQLRPKTGDRYVRLESFTEYKNRVTALLPNFPDNVLEYWIFRHYEFISPHYLNLGLNRMRFNKEIWDSNRVYNDIKPYDGDSLDGMGHHVYGRKNWLSEFMLAERTWPEPIIILKNDHIAKWGKPHHLLEGHQRLAYFREIYRKEQSSLKKTHELWVVAL